MNMLQNWPEKTDPKKFVYEDIGIASYLMLLWNEGNIPTEETKKMKFVDLGCGNGLLVHILNSEGHKGVGLDIRKRKIWDLYPPSTILKVTPKSFIKYCQKIDKNMFSGGNNHTLCKLCLSRGRLADWKSF